MKSQISDAILEKEDNINRKISGVSIKRYCKGIEKLAKSHGLIDDISTIEFRIIAGVLYLKGID
jgi:hypothetical protein